MQQTIMRRIGQRTCGRIQMLEVEVNGDVVIVRGCAPCYYVKQLALLGVLDVLGGTASRRIELDVEVVDSPANCEAKGY